MSKQLEITSINLLTDSDGVLQVVCTIPKKYKDETTKAVLTAKERLKGNKQTAIVIDGLKRPRSLDANAYFHVLVEKIATAVKQSNEQVKQRLVVDYGKSFATARLPKAVEPKLYWNYYKPIDESEKWTEYILYKPTHLMETNEMARLIDGTIAEAKELGIETMTPRELAQLGGYNGNGTNQAKR